MKKNREAIQENLQNKPKKKKLAKTRKVLKYVGVGVAATILGVGIYNYFRTNSFKKPPVKDPHIPSEVIDPNGKDPNIDSSGQVKSDTMSELEKKVLKENFESFLLKDANSRSEQKINQISDMLSISLMPFNKIDGENEFDKYYLSILFKDEGNLYTLNYLVGKDFESLSELSVDYFADFINFLNTECALDTCETMNEDGEKLKDSLGEDVIFVGNPYIGYEGSGDEFYYVPVYNADGSGRVYYVYAPTIDAFNINPMEMLYGELFENAGSEFSYEEFTQSDNLQKIFDIYEELKPSKTQENNIQQEIEK